MMISSFWRHLAIIVEEDVSFFVQHYHHHTYLEMYSRFQANNMNAEMPKKSSYIHVQLLPICSGLF